MENEKHFYPEYKSGTEQEPSVHSFKFVNLGTGEDEQFRVEGTDGIVTKMNYWWKEICNAKGINPNDKKFKNVDYFLMELGKNALEYGQSGEIKVIFEPNKITVVVSDQGSGFKDKQDVEYSSSSECGHGLNQVRKYSDEFYIETGGKKYAKVKGKRKLIDIGTSDTTAGSKITFIKIFE